MKNKRKKSDWLKKAIEKEKYQVRCTVIFLKFLKVLIESLNANKNDNIKVDKIIGLIKPELLKLEKSVKQQEQRLMQLSVELDRAS